MSKERVKTVGNCHPHICSTNHLSFLRKFRRGKQNIELSTMLFLRAKLDFEFQLYLRKVFKGSSPFFSPVFGLTIGRLHLLKKDSRDQSIL